MSNKPDITAAEKHLQERFPTLIGQEQVAFIMTEFATIEAQRFAEWCGQNNWIHWHDEKWRKIILINEFRHEHQHATTAELYNSEEFKRYKEGNK